MKRHLLLFIILCNIYSYSYSQLNISNVKHLYSIFQTDNIFDFSTTNNSNHIVTGYYEINLFNESNNSILYFKSGLIDIQPGIQNNWTGIQTSGTYTYFNSLESQNLKTQGILLLGHYEICIEFIYVTSEAIPIRSCYDFDVLNSIGLRLVSPCNGCEIISPLPLLNWIALMSVDNLYQYTIRICKIEKSQTEAESQANNIPLIYLTGLTQNYIQYELKYPTLDERYSYSWQVCLTKNNLVVLQSEIWTFHLPSQSKQVVHDDLRNITPFQNQHEYLFVKGVSFLYDNKFDMKIINCKIEDLSNGSNTIYQKDIQLHSYLNEIEIAFSDIPKLNSNHYYLLSFYDIRRQPYFLYFKQKE